ncbi:hypothetical protein AB0D38_20350 [Streptomyces sp. NPDC048279]|uniref:hypothetical protein n=1 Tax=Streptomyces sp. NPDC048279 TaxID=3154714 RepID=UPI0034260AA5
MASRAVPARRLRTEFSRRHLAFSVEEAAVPRQAGVRSWSPYCPRRGRKRAAGAIMRAIAPLYAITRKPSAPASADYWGSPDRTAPDALGMRWQTEGSDTTLPAPGFWDGQRMCV